MHVPVVSQAELSEVAFVVQLAMAGDDDALALRMLDYARRRFGVDALGAAEVCTLQHL